MILILSLGDIRSLDTAADNIVGAADDMGLQLNISKTKYMFSADMLFNLEV